MAHHDRTNDSLGDRGERAADAALRGHDEPATTGDVVGETTGGVAGAATGAALGSLGGPIGTIIGGLAGAVGGWWSGRAISEAASTFDNDDDAFYRSHYQSNAGRTGASSASYDDRRPAYQLGHLAGVNPDYRGRSFDEVESHLQSAYTSSGSEDWSEVRGFARDAYSRGQEVGEQRLTLSEEQLNVGKRQVQAGEVGLRKTVETEHVRESVPLSREEVTIERRPLSGAEAAGATIGEDEEIRIPLMAEEAVVEKRAVAKEEVSVRKEAVTENQTVEADLRRERLEVDRDVDSRRTGTSSGAADLSSGSSSSGAGLGDRLANGLDDLKDRVDGNPASRPGPDATDRRP